MKKYNVTVTDKKTKETLLDIDELSNTMKYLKSKYRAKFIHRSNECIVKVKRLVRKSGVQIKMFE